MADQADLVDLINLEIGQAQATLDLMIRMSSGDDGSDRFDGLRDSTLHYALYSVQLRLDAIRNAANKEETSDIIAAK